MTNLKNQARQLRRQQTDEEKQLWRALRNSRFAGFKFRRQHWMEKYVLDFYCVFARLSVELDGFQHGSAEQQLHDRKRRQWLEGQGIEELRFWNHNGGKIGPEFFWRFGTHCSAGRGA